MTKAPSNHYHVLRVDRRASQERVKHAYRRLAQQHHPDRQPGRGDAAAVMARINEAYAVLSDPVQRAAYDASLQPQAAPAAGGARAAAMAMQDRFGWSGWLLLAIACVAVLTLGFVAQRLLAPARPVFVAPVTMPAPAVDATPIAPVHSIQPWTEPARQARPVNEATEPVARLVREGVITKAPTRRAEGTKAQ